MGLLYYLPTENGDHFVVINPANNSINNKLTPYTADGIKTSSNENLCIVNNSTPITGRTNAYEFIIAQHISTVAARVFPL